MYVILINCDLKQNEKLKIFTIQKIIVIFIEFFVSIKSKLHLCFLWRAFKIEDKDHKQALSSILTSETNPDKPLTNL